MKKIIGFHLRSIKGMLACAVIYHVLVMAGLCQEHGHLDLSYYFFIWVIMAVFMIVIMASLDDLWYGPPSRTMYSLPYPRRQIIGALLMTKALLAGLQTMAAVAFMLYLQESISHLLSIVSLGLMAYLAAVLYFIMLSRQQDRSGLMHFLLVAACLAASVLIFVGWTQLLSAILTLLILLGLDLLLSVLLLRQGG